MYASVFRPDLFKDQVVAVTGGGSGIGRCIAHELSSLGATVALIGRTEEKLQSVAKEIEADGGQASTHSVDIREEEGVQDVLRSIVKTHKRLDGLVNNAGGQFASPAANIKLKGWKAVVDTNLTGTFIMCKAAFEVWMCDHGGSIVNIVADMWRGMPMMSHSGAARAAVVNLTKSLALEWSNNHIRVNAVAPGLIHSSGFDTYPEPVREVLKALPNELPARRFGTESEVSSAVAFLLSSGAAYVSGATLRVDAASSLYRHTFSLPDQEPIPSFGGFHRSTVEPPAGSEGTEE